MKQIECKWYAVCPMKFFFMGGKLDKKWIDYYCKKNWNECIRFKQEELHIPHPNNMLPDGSIDNSLF